MYCNIDINSLDGVELSHKDIKFLMPDLKRISFEDLASDMRKLYIGKVIAVEDSFGNVAPYICPKIKEINMIYPYQMINVYHVIKI